MAYGFLDIASTRSVRAAQEANGSRELWQRFDGDRASDQFTENEIAFIEARDSFYLASVSNRAGRTCSIAAARPASSKYSTKRRSGSPTFAVTGSTSAWATSAPMIASP